MHTARAVMNFWQTILSDVSKNDRRYQNYPKSKRNERHTLEGEKKEGHAQLYEVGLSRRYSE